jgi:hypothetical protein
MAASRYLYLHTSSRGHCGDTFDGPMLSCSMTMLISHLPTMRDAAKAMTAPRLSYFDHPVNFHLPSSLGCHGHIWIKSVHFIRLVWRVSSFQSSLLSRGGRGGKSPPAPDTVCSFPQRWPYITKPKFLPVPSIIFLSFSSSLHSVPSSAHLPLVSPAPSFRYSPIVQRSPTPHQSSGHSSIIRR